MVELATLRTTVSKLKKAKLSAQKYAEAEKPLQQPLAIADYANANQLQPNQVIELA